MKRTKICDLLDIKYPIVQAPMAYIAGPELAAGVSNAGGLGVVGPLAGVSLTPSRGNLNIVGERTRQQIKTTRSLTNKPFAINVIISRYKMMDYTDCSLEVCLEENLPLIYLSYNEYDSPPPEPYIKKAKEGGAKVLVRPVNCTSEMARKLEAAGVDILVAAGYDAGGHSGKDKIPTLTLVPYIVNAVNIPVVSGGGIGDARGVVAMFALGVDGVLIGSRFIPTYECDAPQSVKQAVLTCQENSTVTYSGPNGEARALKNMLMERILSMQANGASWEEIDKAAYSGQVRSGLVEGDIQWGAVFVGPGAGMAKAITSAEEVMASLIEGYQIIVDNL